MCATSIRRQHNDGGAGLVLANAQAWRRAPDRCSRLSLAPEGSCQIGGMLSTNAGGTAVSIRQHAGARAGARSGARRRQHLERPQRLRKDNTGYDLKQLFIGAEGTLGIITAAVLSSSQTAETRDRVRRAGPARLRPLLLLARLRSRRAVVTAFEMMPRIGLSSSCASCGTTRSVAQARSLVRADRPDCPRQGADRRLAKTLLRRGLDAGSIADAVVADRWRRARCGACASCVRGAEARRRQDQARRRGAGPRVPDSSPRQAARGSDPGARPVPFGHLGDGNIHFNLSQPPAHGPGGFLANGDALKRVHEIVHDLGGSISAEHGIGRLKRDLLPHAKQVAPARADAQDQVGVRPQQHSQSRQTA